MTNVVKFTGITTVDIEASEMLRNIANEDPKHAFVITWSEADGVPTYYGTTSDMPLVLLRLNEFIHRYYSGDFQ